MTALLAPPIGLRLMARFPRKPPREGQDSRLPNRRSQPTQAQPGSPEKINILTERIQNFEDVWTPGDRVLDPEESAGAAPLNIESDNEDAQDDEEDPAESVEVSETLDEVRQIVQLMADTGVNQRKAWRVFRLMNRGMTRPEAMEITRLTEAGTMTERDAWRVVREAEERIVARLREDGLSFREAWKIAREAERENNLE